MIGKFYLFPFLASLPSEWPVCPGLNKEPIGEGGTITGPDDVDIVHVSSRDLSPNFSDEVDDEADIVRLARLSVDIPASLITIWSHNDTVISQPASYRDGVSLATITMEMKHHRNLLPSSCGRNSNLSSPGTRTVNNLLISSLSTPCIPCIS